MPSHDYFDLVVGAVPRNFDPNQLKTYGKPEWWETNPFLACAYALRKCPQIDWEAYLEWNPDVRKAGIDPVLHFLRDGVFEGRVLYTHAVGASSALNDIPKVSVIVPNHNNAFFLPYSINTLLGQTLKEIEVILVDDASTDNSLEIINSFAAADPRVKVISLDVNQSQHMARKAGVAAATAKYIMFMDADDHYTSNACEVAYSWGRRGFDIVTFGVYVLTMSKANHVDATKTLAYLNSGQAKVYQGAELMASLFLRHAPSKTLWNKIYETALAKAAFLEMEDICLFGAEDIYEISVLASKAKRMLKINDKLYVYRFGSGCTTTNGACKRAKSSADATMVAAPLRRFTQKMGMARFYDQLMGNIYHQAANSFISHVPPEEVTSYFNMVAGNLGVVDFIIKLMMTVDKCVDKIANKFQYYDNSKLRNKPVIKSIGILWSFLSIGGTQNVIKFLAPCLINIGYDVVLFLEEPYEYDFQLPRNIRVVYYGHQNIRRMLHGLYVALINNPVELMLYQANYKHTVLFQIMLMKYLGIRVISFLHEAFYHKLLSTTGFYDSMTFAAVMRCADKLSVLSHYDAIYYHNLNIDAVYIPNPIPVPPSDIATKHEFKRRKNKIVALGRLGDPTKRITDCLHILKEVTRKKPYIEMILIGEFNDQNLYNSFISLAANLGIVDNLRLAGWVNDPTPLLDDAAVLISAAWHEAFPLSVAEAQARGLPVVMYDLPIAQAIDNPSIIRVPHGATYTAAQEVLAILDSEARWIELSCIAKRRSRQFGPERYTKNVLKLIKTFENRSPVSKTTPQDYQVIMRTLAFYGSTVPPWERN